MSTSELSEYSPNETHWVSGNSLGFREIIPANWLNGDPAQQFRMRAFPTFFQDADALHKFLRLKDGGLISPWRKIILGFATQNNLDIIIPTAVMVSDERGQMRLLGSLTSMKVDTVFGFFVIAPVSLGSEDDAAQKIDKLIAWITLNFGYNFAHYPFLDVVLEVGNDATSAASNLLRTPSFVDGPLLQADLFDQFNELNRVYSVLTDDIRTRIDRSLELVYRSQREIDATDSFLSSWTAIEVLTGGSKIRSKIHARYKGLGLANIDIELGLPALTNIRQKLIHNGQKLSSFSEHHIRKYIQLIILDLIRNLAGLDDRAIAVSHRAQWQLDLRGLHLPDYRTAELSAIEPYVDPVVRFM